MSVNDPCFVSWEEHILCHERGNRAVHFFLKDTSGQLILAVVGTERSIRHMLFVVPDEFIQAYGSSISISSCKKWRARREVVDWLTSLVSKHCPSSFVANLDMNDSEQGVESFQVSMSRFNTELTYLREQMVPRKLKVQNSDIKWSGAAWICSKQLKNYPSFHCNETTITVHSFVFIMAEEGSHYLGYLEGLYEDKRGLKKVKVRWLHHNQEVKGLMPALNPHPREVFMTPHVQVISAECVDGPATVLTPKHYEKCMALISESSSSGVYMCFRQFINNRIKPFTLTKLRGYSNQAILSSIDDSFVSRQKTKFYKPCKGELVFGLPANVGAKRNRNPAPENEVAKCGTTYPKLRLKLPRKTMSTQAVASQAHHPSSFKVNQKIELLCQDSGMRGCWFRCTVLRASSMKLKVRYDDVQDVEGPGNLEEWVPASRVATPDKLGMRCEGRRTIRPYPPEESIDYSFEVGAAVDAWWSDGWWEGVLTGVNISGNYTHQVYIPGEGKYITVQQKSLRTSKDWIDGRWIAIKAKSDKLSYLAASVSVCGGSVLLEHKPLTISKLEAVVEDSFAESDNLLVNVKGVVSEKHARTCAGDGIIINSCGVGNNDNHSIAVCGDKLLSKEDFETSKLEM